MSAPFALSARRIFDGQKWHVDTSLVIKNGLIKQILPTLELPAGLSLTDLEEGIICPGFVDLQVNGGGGVLLNNDPSVEGIRTICATHARFGTTSLFPTLITDSNEVRAAALAAAIQARKEKVPGFAGLHLEGPHLSIARKGAHDPRLIRKMTDEDVALLVEAHPKIGMLMITLAPESVTPNQVRALSKAGIRISLGHSDAGIDQVEALKVAGATMFTHLFNAMSQMSGREPGMVGCALSGGHASIIADGHHVHPASIKLALAAKKNQPGKVFLISDAMSFAGTNCKELVLNGRKILRRGGKLTLHDGTLAGADIQMDSAVQFMHQKIEMELGEAIRMATAYPAAAAGLTAVGHLRVGAPADFVWLNDKIEPQSTWIAGRKIPA
ncbi:MAG: N-acetylglucosamine-6-phosphate deacetylase [Devosiaceae bacterium]|nr:N-acetylglucosamine-6-phosphate deacetylase [Devosiaceae bacterium]